MASCISAQKIDRNQNINHITLAFSIDFTFCPLSSLNISALSEKRNLIGRTEWSNANILGIQIDLQQINRREQVFVLK